MYVCCKDKTPTDPYVSNRVGYEQRVVIRNNREDDKRGCFEGCRREDKVVETSVGV